MGACIASQQRHTKDRRDSRPPPHCTSPEDNPIDTEQNSTVYPQAVPSQILFRDPTPLDKSSELESKQFERMHSYPEDLGRD